VLLRHPLNMEKLDIGGIITFEHVNLNVPHQYEAMTYYLEGLGLTRDPFTRVGTTTMWCNVGSQQIHLPTGEPQVINGHIGLVVPSIDHLISRLSAVAPKLQETKFSFEKITCSGVYNDHEECVAVTGPYGNKFRVYESRKEFFDKSGLGINYLEELCGVGTAKLIALFYQTYFDTPFVVCEDDGHVVVKVVVGCNQFFIFRETDEEILEYSGYHVAIYINKFCQIYEKFQAEDLLFKFNRFKDTYATLEEALDWHQFRIHDIVDPSTKQVVHKLEHEVRSLYHPSFLRPLVNRASFGAAFTTDFNN